MRKATYQLYICKIMVHNFIVRGVINLKRILIHLTILVLSLSPALAVGGENYKWVDEESIILSQSSSGFIPFDKFKYLTEGMSEAEVLSRFGPPTREMKDEIEVEGYFTRRGIIKREVQVKRFYYIGNPDLGERTTIIHFKNGIVQKIERIFPPTW